jgi:hypothetical protein
MRILLWLYPRSWRRKYGLEMEALLRQMRGRDCGRGRLALALDLVRGAADAHLHPQLPGRRRLRWLAAVLGIAVAVLVCSVVVATARQPVAAAVLAAVWLPVALAWRWLGSRTLFLFSAMVALRFPADRALALGLVHLDPAALPYRAGAGVLEVALGGAVAVLVLRRTRLRWPVALAAGCLLELVFAVLLQRWQALPVVEPLGVVLWAAGLAWLARLRRPRPWHGPPEGAPVAARPSPPGPEPLSARARRAS